QDLPQSRLAFNCVAKNDLKLLILHIRMTLNLCSSILCCSVRIADMLKQVTTLVNTSNKGPSGKKKGRSKKAHVLAASVEQATQNFLEKGEQIAKESQDLKEELVAAVEDVRKQGCMADMKGAQNA
ncbi:hypothetical protein STEG23_009833, partial [Scotinomys teguina]